MVNVPQLCLCLYRQTLVCPRCTRRGQEPIFWMRVFFSSQTSTLLSLIVIVCQLHYSRFRSCGFHALILIPLQMKADSQQQSRAVQLLLHRKEQDQLTRDKPRSNNRAPPIKLPKSRSVENLMANAGRLLTPAQSGNFEDEVDFGGSEP